MMAGNAAIQEERAIVGALLAYGADGVLTQLRPEQIQGGQCRAVWSAAMALDASGREVDALSVADEMERAGTLEIAGGRVGLSELASGAPPTPLSAPGLAAIIREATTRRTIQDACMRAVEDAADRSVPVQSVIAGVVGALEATDGMQPGEDYRHVGAGVEDVWQTLDAIASGRQATGIGTGFVDIDAKIGSLRPGDLAILAARPSIGKTALALSIAAKCGVPVGIFSLEMSLPSLAVRMLAQAGMVDVQHIIQGRLMRTEWEKLVGAAKVLTESRIYVDDTGGLPIGLLKSRANRMRRKHGIGLVVVDYLQLLTVTSQRGRSRENEVSQISQELKALAKQLGVPVLALSQLNRSADGIVPSLSHLRESGAIEQDADLVMLLHRAKKSELEAGSLIVAKNRNGPTGAVPLVWRGYCTRFEDAAKRMETGEPAFAVEDGTW